MKTKAIDKKDYEKVFNSIYWLELREKFKGCLFIYDDNFNRKFKEMMDNYMGGTFGIDLDLWLKLIKILN